MNAEQIYNFLLGSYPDKVAGYNKFNSIQLGDDDTKRILKELNEIQSSIEVVTVQTEKKKRNETLVKKLKELYRNKCQICDAENGIPYIEKKDGSYYCFWQHKFLAVRNLIFRAPLSH